jgi:catechol 2,3-dioxygenase-like lactoylglutathione lyase family enzyme
MISIKKIDHIVLRTANPKQMIAFYCDTLNCEVEREEEDLDLAQLRAGECLIDIVAVDGELGKQGCSAPTSESNNLDHFCLQIQSCDEQELIDYLKGKNIAVGKFEGRYGAEGQGRSIYINDTDGNTVELKLSE